MPYYKRRFKRTYKRTYKKRTLKRKVMRKSRNRVRPAKIGMYIADTTYQKLKYTTILNTLDTVSDDFNFNVFKLNSPYDPGYTKSTNNATGVAIFGAQYFKFFVRSSAIKIMVVNTDTDIPLRIAVFPSTLTDSTITATNDSGLLGNPYVKTTMLGNATGMDTKMLKNYIAVRKMYGAKYSSANDTTLTGATTATGSQTDPGAIFNWIITAQALSNVADNVNCILSVEITYYVQFFDRVGAQ